ncbi:MAG: hypothetical protein COT85_05110 [Chlamydiae bacterium CG10_big_fil_rev_8_21_14_0_10_42_34]|nr:MAG: hypothetical protein COT85_05110 [Chlamydiae bacterium CG10_big_fil_rev_8_21_14_0_10_42_34]
MSAFMFPLCTPGLYEGEEEKSLFESKGGTSLMRACEKLDLLAVMAFINQGHDVHAKDQNGRGVLHYLARPAYSELSHIYSIWSILSVLGNSEVDFNAKDNEGKTPLDLLAEKSNAFAIALFQAGGAKDAKNLGSIDSLLSQKSWRSECENMKKVYGKWEMSITEKTVVKNVSVFQHQIRKYDYLKKYIKVCEQLDRVYPD